MSNLSVLIHTFDGYKHLWRGMSKSLLSYWDEFEHDVPVYWGSDIYTTQAEWFGTMILSGEGHWSDRLDILIKQISTDYILYMQEDHWLTKSPPDMYDIMQIVTEKQLLRLQLSPIVPFYKLNQEGEIHYFDPTSKYLVSHQPSIWKKSFLLECLKPGETPWVNEYEGTKRLKNDPKIHKKIAIYPYEWYKHMCIKGKMVEVG